LIMANTVMRHGTEAHNLKWPHINHFDERVQPHLATSVTGEKQCGVTSYVAHVL